MEGYIKVFRKLVEWEWYTNIETKTLFLHCLLKASYKEQKYQGKEIQVGDFISTIYQLSAETGLTVAQVRTALSHLVKTGELAKKTYNKYTIFTVVNYKKYQQDANNQQADNIQSASNQQTDSKQEIGQDNKKNTDNYKKNEEQEMNNQKPDDKQQTINQQTDNNENTNNQQTNSNQIADNQQADNKQITDNQQTDNKQIATIKEYKESKESKERENLNNNNIKVGTEEQVPTLPKFLNNSFEMRCVERLILSCLATCPGAKVPDTPQKKEKWCVEIDRMKRLDKRTEEDILKVLEYATTNTFWKSNIRSAENLRKKYEILMAQLRSKEEKKKTNKFNNFESREVDFTDFEKQLLGCKNM